MGCMHADQDCLDLLEDHLTSKIHDIEDLTK